MAQIATSWARGWLVARWRLGPAAGFALVAAALYTISLFAGPNPVTESVDWVLHGQPNLHFFREGIWSGSFPWWNPHVGLGRPYASDLQSAVYYPLTYVYLLGDVAGLSLFIGAHSFLLILGMHLLCRQLGGRGVLGLLGGCALLTSMGVSGRLFVGHTFYFAGWCYFPLLLGLTVRLKLRPTPRRIGVLALLLGLQFLTGHPQVFWLSTLGLALFLAGLLAQSSTLRQWRRVPRVLAGAVLAVVIAAGIASCAWLPFLDLVAEGNRRATSLESAANGPLHLFDMLNFVMKPPAPYATSWEQNYRLGFAWAVPGLAGLCMVRSLAGRALCVVGILAISFSFGETSGIFRMSFDWLPGASSFRIPARIGVLPVTAMIVGAAIYLSRPRRLAAISEGVFLGFGLVFLGYQVCPYPDEVVAVEARDFIPLALFLVAAASVGWWWDRARQPNAIRTTAVFLWMGLQCLEFGATHVQFRQLYSYESQFKSRSHFPVAEQVKADLPRAASGVPPRLLINRDRVPPNLGMRDGWAHVDSYTALFLNRPWNFLHAAVGADRDLTSSAFLPEKVYQSGPFPFPNLSQNFAMPLNSTVLITNPAPVPRVWVTFHPRLVGGPEEALAAVTNRLNLPSEGVIETALPFGPVAADAAGKAVIVRFDPNEIAVDCQLSHPGLLVLNEAWFPGWHTIVAGQRVESQPANYWMRGFALSAGEHHLTVRFRPRRQALAVGLSLAALAGCGALLGARGWHSRRAGFSRASNSPAGLKS